MESLSPAQEQKCFSSGDGEPRPSGPPEDFGLLNIKQFYLKEKRLLLLKR